MGPRLPRYLRCPCPLFLESLEARTLLSDTPSASPAGGQRPAPTGPTGPTAAVFLSESTTAAAYGNDITLVARVTTSAPSGTGGAVVNFVDQEATGDVLLASVPVENNTARFVWANASVANHQIVAEMAATTTFPTAASAPVELTVSPAATQVRLAAASQKLVATVAADAAITTGTISFFAGTRELATVRVSPKGTAVLPVTALRSTNQAIVAAYNGAANFSPSTSKAFPAHVTMHTQNFGFGFCCWSH